MIAITRPGANACISTLFLEGNESETEHVLSGLSPEFFMQVEWLPGGRFEEGEFLFDSLFDEAASHPEDKELLRLCDPRAKGIIFNLIREEGDLEYVNVGCVPESLSIDRPQKEGRRGVYLVEFHSRSERAPIKRFIRLQKWGIWEHLDEGKDLLQSIKESDDYTDYWLDRRLGCRQLGMNMTHRVAMRRLSEIYHGKQRPVPGRADSNHLLRAGVSARHCHRQGADGEVCPARLRAEAGEPAGPGRRLEHDCRAAPSTPARARRLMMATRWCGRATMGSRRKSWWATTAARLVITSCPWKPPPLTMPGQSISGTMSCPIRKRSPPPTWTPFAQHFLHIQGDYRKRRRAFDTLFKHCKYDDGGSFAFRWECVLRRLDQTNADALVEAVRRQIFVLQGEPVKPPAPAPAAPAAKPQGLGQEGPHSNT